jgi:putative cell wall-binding protein
VLVSLQEFNAFKLNHMQKILVSLIGLTLLAGSFAFSGSVSAAQEDLVRISGDTRITTAEQISRYTYMTDGTAKSALFYNANAIADALVAAPLARITEGPLLPVLKDSIPAEIETELLRAVPLGKTVYVLGGPDVVSDTVFFKLVNLGYVVERLGANDRYHTSNKVAEKIQNLLGKSTTSFWLVSGTSLADALSVAPKAALDKQPILLSTHDSLTQNVIDFIADKSLTDVMVAGGQMAGARGEINAMGFGLWNTHWYYGRDRYQTSRRIADLFVSNTPAPLGVGIASGETLVDALPAAPHLVNTGVPILNNFPLLLVKKDDVACLEAGDFLRDYKDRINVGYLYGGGAVISATTETRAEQLMSGMITPETFGCETIPQS